KKSNQRCFCQVKSRKEKGKSFGMDDFLLFTFAFFLEPASANKSEKKSNQRCFCQVKSRKEKGKS
ncbi:MAG: hypothetical protein ACK5XC_10770, partial [Pseudanabaena sp.]